jgi:hypothetical protein
MQPVTRRRRGYRSNRQAAMLNHERVKCRNAIRTSGVAIGVDDDKSQIRMRTPNAGYDVTLGHPKLAW